ncbi:uncharacterized protein GGS22DRAFT_195330 [Annulohypoxylon maeteangense]|uniref:uncharacterized protein n=1 Tax=Annulohypoxylon maeteangense TaxID=1927788 RepID=UPI0020080B64|nr:uncharacterized protein GGS22DRAFT_195330 [Annulohypoxylon maeteangense]KAI0883045.1 hypothetical protein GGS22DRAFT_195330 [Annulohypoxylon maeteangense]
MQFLTRKPVCLCHEGTRRSGAVLKLLQQGFKPTRSGKCPACTVGHHREGKVLDKLPASIESLAGTGKPIESARGYGDDNASGRLSIIQIISEYACGLTIEEEIDIANRVYAQLKMENHPLTYAGWELFVEVFSDSVFTQIRSVIHAQLSFFWDNKVSGAELFF